VNGGKPRVVRHSGKQFLPLFAVFKKPVQELKSKNLKFNPWVLLLTERWRKRDFLIFTFKF
jgi:hypothetical protein